MFVKKEEDSRLFGHPETFFEDKETGDQFCRVAGGLAWPSGANPGGVVVVAETRRVDPVLRKRPYNVLVTYETLDVGRLLNVCKDLRARYFLKPFYTDMSNKPMIDHLYRLNVTGLHVMDAPFSDDPDGFRYYIALIQELTNPNRRILYLGHDKTLPAHLRQIDATKIRGATIEEYPLLSALGFCLSGLESYAYDPRVRFEQNSKFYDHEGKLVEIVTEI